LRRKKAVSKSAKQSIKSSRRAKPKKAASTTSKSAGTPPGPEVTLQASRRFWLITLGGVLLILALVQGYGYFTGWGNPHKVMQRHFKTARNLTLAKRYKAAISQYQKIMKKKHVSQEQIQQALIGLGDLYYEQNQWSQAVETYRRLQMEESSGVMQAWTGLRIAESQNKAGDWETALKTYAEISQKYPQSDWDAEARLGQGKVLEDAKRWDKAVAAYAGLINDYPGGFLAADALVHQGSCHEKLGNRAEARQAYQTVMEKYPAAMRDEARRRLQRLNMGKKSPGISQWGK
jgi:TolA-binding protein